MEPKGGPNDRVSYKPDPIGPDRAPPGKLWGTKHTLKKKIKGWVWGGKKDPPRPPRPDPGPERRGP